MEHPSQPISSPPSTQAITGDLSLVTFTTCWRFETPISLRGYAGHTIRGALGHALRSLACTHPDSTCRTCERRSDCPYTRLFEPYPPPAEGAVPGPKDHWPVPYTFHPIDWTPNSTASPTRRPLTVQWTLVGQGIPFLPQLASALELAGMHGLGKDRVRAFTEWPDGRPTDRDGRSLSVLVQTRLDQLAATHRGVRIHVLSPLRLTKNGRPRDTFALSPLLHAVNRRLRLLCRAVGAEEPAVPPPPREQTDADIEVSPHLSWFETEHHSQRQKQSYPIGGHIGHVDLRGEVASVLPWLVLGEMLHVGKATSSGFGLFALEPLPT